ncbi:MAG: hypothetical protein ACOWW1_04630 [archaeon]
MFILPPKDDLIGNSTPEIFSFLIGFLSSEVGRLFLGVTIVALVLVITLVIVARKKSRNNISEG